MSREEREKNEMRTGCMKILDKKKGGGGVYSDNSSSDTTNINLLAVTFEMNVCVCNSL